MSEPSEAAKQAAASWFMDGNSNVAAHQAYARGYDAATAELREELAVERGKLERAMGEVRHLVKLNESRYADNERQKRALDWLDSFETPEIRAQIKQMLSGETPPPAVE